ncbi:zinc finger BED domain-containing protein 1-like [Notolabrus celidotus]|uniref:zinc finger BED domain-containing protein 1-like n=1 Tax=Notolabrus celidotus TaxID=1203425 RepID=UPI0014907754|nr:zinc finger BED domain-containing protein 1-like [Notolabrus celidotus]
MLLFLSVVKALSVIAPHAQLLADFTPAPEDDPMTHEIKHAIREDLRKRYTCTKERHTLHTAPALDPRFKALPFLSEDENVETYSRVTTEAASLEVVREDAEVSERECDYMAEGYDDGEEDGAVGKVRDKAPKLEEYSPPTSRPSSLTALLGQTFSVVTTVVPKSAQTRAEEEVHMYLEATSLPLTDDPLEWWRSNDPVYPLLAKGLTILTVCIPGTSVAAESVLHCGGHCVSTTEHTHSTTCGPAGLPP